MVCDRGDPPHPVDTRIRWVAMKPSSTYLKSPVGNGLPTSQQIRTVPDMTTAIGEQLTHPDPDVCAALTVLAGKLQHVPAPGIQQIAASYALAVHAHGAQQRASGQPYIIHPIEVASIVADLGMDADTISAALLHDTIEDTGITRSDLASVINSDVASLVDGVTKLDKIAAAARANSGIDAATAAAAATMKKMLVAATTDIRVLVVKLADRTHNVSTLQWLPVSKQQRIAAETLHVYVPLAHRLGIDTIRERLEDEAFAVLEPDLFTELKSMIDGAQPDADARLDIAVTALNTTFTEAGIPADIAGRTKTVYSVYRKMLNRQVTFDEIADLVGIRIITDTLTHTYEGLGLAHATFPPIPGRIRDYIATPKFNAYQSLHTAVTVNSAPVEIQLRTRDMHIAAELGVAAHWRYKTSDTTPAPPVLATAATLPWLDRLRSYGSIIDNDDTYLRTLRNDLAGGEILALTHTCEPVSVPEHATCLDFAFAAGTPDAEHAVAARIDGRLVSLNEPVRPGAMIDIITDPSSRIDQSKLRHVRTPQAAAAIQAGLTANAHISSVAADIIAGLPEQWWTLIDVDMLSSLFGGLNLQHAIGAGEISGSDVARTISRLLNSPASGSLRIDGYPDTPTLVAPCCSPKPGDQVSVTVWDHTLLVHITGCVHISGRIVTDTVWPETAPVIATITVTGIDRPGLLAEVANVVEGAGLNVQSHTGHTSSDAKAHLQFIMDFSGHTQLAALGDRIRSVAGVYEVDTGLSPTPQTGTPAASGDTASPHALRQPA